MCSLVVCAAALVAAQDASQPEGPAQPTGPAKHGGLFSRKPKVVLSPEEEARQKAEIQRQIDVLPRQGAPILDESGKQILDPDARPMFQPAPRPLLDKHGQPVLDEDGKLLLQTKDHLGYDAHGKKLKAEKEKIPKKVPVTIEQGTLTVDGWTGKARLNYEIDDLKYLYIYAPGIGNTVVSTLPFPGATAQKNAFDGKTLTISVGEHQLQIAGEKPLLHQKHPVPAYVLVDREYSRESRFPVMGYGPLRRAPYAWPAAKAVETRAPALPKEVMPVLARPAETPGKQP